MSRRKILILGLLILLLLTSGWLWTQRVQRVAMEAYVPESALGFVEVNDLPQLVNQFTSTTAWQSLAPAYELPETLGWLGSVGTLARWTGIGPAESVVLSRAQIAVAITGLEVRGEEVRPRLALIAETHTNESRLRSVIDSRLPQLAERAYKNAVLEATDYLNTPITIYREPKGERRLLSAQLGSVWILANHPDAMRASLETALGRSPSMANSNFYLKNARSRVEGRHPGLFAFVTGTGVSRLTQFATSLIAGRVASTTPFAGALEGLLSDVSARVADGLAYGASFENGGVISRSQILLKPALTDKLRTSAIVSGNSTEVGEPRALQLAPQRSRDITVVRIENPIKAMDDLELAISSQLGTGQAFVLHRIFLGAREALLGIKPNEKPAPAFGNEIASISLGEDIADRVLLIAARDRALLQGFAERYLMAGGATIQRQSLPESGVQLLSSSNDKRGVAAFIGEFLALGGKAQIKTLLDEYLSQRALSKLPAFQNASRPNQPGVIVSYSSVREETMDLMQSLSRRLNGGVRGNETAIATALDKLPLASSATAINEQGLFIESHAPLGGFPLMISLLGDSSEK